MSKALAPHVYTALAPHDYAAIAPHDYKDLALHVYTAPAPQDIMALAPYDSTGPGPSPRALYAKNSEFKFVTFAPHIHPARASRLHGPRAS